MWSSADSNTLKAFMNNKTLINPTTIFEANSTQMKQASMPTMACVQRHIP